MPVPIRFSEKALRPCAIYCKTTGGFHQKCDAHLYAGIRSIIVTARRRAVDASRLTLRAEPIDLAV